MKEKQSLNQLPKDLPEPFDDGAANHLEGAPLPSVELISTEDERIDLSQWTSQTVVYCYPMTGRPDRQEIPKGWNDIPGARGCTPQSCAFRDHHSELRSLGVNVVGLSAQPTDDQREAKERLQLPFTLVSDSRLRLADSLGLPTFTVANRRFLKRTTLIIRNGRIEKVFYPVFPPDRNADEVISWLKKHIPAGQ